jgi:hypothetical protein
MSFRSCLLATAIVSVEPSGLSLKPATSLTPVLGGAIVISQRGRGSPLRRRN